MANEQVQQYLEKLKKNKETATIVTLCLLLAVVGLVYMQEQQRTSVEVPPVTQVPMPPVIAPEDMVVVDSMFDVEAAPTTAVRTLLSYSLFQSHNAAQVNQLKASADQIYASASARMAQGDTAGAKAACLEALAIYPPHPKANELLDTIKAAEAPAATPVADVGAGI